MPDVAAPGGLIHPVIPLHDLIAAERRRHRPPFPFQFPLPYPDAKLKRLIRVISDHQIPVGIGAGGTAAEGLGPIGIRKHVVRVAVPLHHGQRCVERHPEDQIGELAEPSTHIAADPAQEQQGLNSVYAADRSTVEMIRKAVSDLDAVSGGVWTVNVGYGCTEIVDAMAEQLKKFNYFSNANGNIPTILFSDKLISKMPGMNRVYLNNSGSEANEKAYKIVRQISQLKHGGKKSKILFRDRDYHGTTITCLSSCGQFERRNQYGPFTPGFVEFPDCSAYRHGLENNPDAGKIFAKQLEDVILREDPDTVGGVIIEPITAGGGVIVPPDGYLEEVGAICKKYGILLIIDRIHT